MLQYRWRTPVSVEDQQMAASADSRAFHPLKWKVGLIVGLLLLSVLTRYLLERFYWLLGGYLEVAKFNLAFVANRLADGNRELFLSYLGSASAIKAFTSLTAAWVLKGGVHPYAPITIVKEAVDGLGVLGGLTFSLSSLFLAAIAYYLAARFLLPEITALITRGSESARNFTRSQAFIYLAMFSAAFPLIPLPLGPALFGAVRLDFKKTLYLLLPACLVRVWLALFL